MVFLENEILYGESFPIDDAALDKDFTVPIGKAKVGTTEVVCMLDPLVVGRGRVRGCTGQERHCAHRQGQDKWAGDCGGDGVRVYWLQKECSTCVAIMQQSTERPSRPPPHTPEHLRAQPPTPTKQVVRPGSDVTLVALVTLTRSPTTPLDAPP